MKEFLKKLDKQTLYAGLFGLIAIIAICFEMKLGGFEADSVAGGIKDIAGTVLDVIMLIVALTAFKPSKKGKGFTAVFLEEMEVILKKYNPMITFYGIESTQNISNAYRYNVANKLKCVATNNPGGNNKLFRIKEGLNELEFSVSETVFKEKREEVAVKIAAKIKDTYGEFVDNYVINKTGFVIKLHNPLSNEADAKNIIKIIDHILMIYLAEYGVGKAK